MNNQKNQPPHFKGKDAVGHVAEAQAQGLIASAEIHGTEMAGHLSAATDAARETTLLMILFSLIFSHLAVPLPSFLLLLSLFCFSWALWKIGRSGWLGWSRLERLHRLLEQEKWEIEHNRDQEREELRVLYQAKGFEGKLLDDVIDVLMADGDRLLRVMVEEEMGLHLQTFEHPIKQSLGAGAGVLISWLLLIGSFYFLGIYALFFTGILILATTAAVTALLTQNRILHAVIWNIGIMTLSVGAFYFLMEFFL